MKRFYLAITLFYSCFVYGQNDFMLAESYVRQGKYAKATQIYKSLLDRNPFNSTYLKKLVTCYQETDQYQKAEYLIRNSLEKNLEQKYLHVELGYNYERQQKMELANKEYATALQSIDLNPSIGGQVGRIFRQNNLLDNAVLAYTKIMELNPNARYQFQVAQIYGEQGEFAKMFDSYIDLVNNNESYVGTVQRLASRYVSNDPLDENNIALKRSLLRKSVSNPKNVWNELLSWLFSKQKEYGKALIQEKALFKRDPKYLENIGTLGNIAFQDQDYIAAKNCFSFLLKNSNFLEEKIISELYLLRVSAATENTSIEQKFENVLDRYGTNANTIKIQIEYADYLTFQKGKPEQSEYVLEKALKLSKSKFERARIKIKLGEIFVFTNRFNKALIYFSQVQTKLKNHPLSQEARFKVAETSYFKGDFSWAMAQLKVLKGSTTQLIANDAVNLFLLISDNQPQDSIPSGLQQYAKADLLAYQNKNAEALKILREIVEKFKGFPIEDEALFKEAKVLVKNKKYKEAVTNFERIIALNLEGILNDDAFFQIAEIYNYKLNLPSKAKEYYQKIIFDHASSIYLVDARKKYRQLRGDDIN